MENFPNINRRGAGIVGGLGNLSNINSRGGGRIFQNFKLKGMKNAYF